jgi:hypothetical protein
MILPLPRLEVYPFGPTSSIWSFAAFCIYEDHLNGGTEGYVFRKSIAFWYAAGPS